MKKFIIFLVCVVMTNVAFAAGENIATSKAYVDTAVAQKQDAIPANDGTAQVLTNTGTPGEIGTKNIYDSTGEYATQTGALVTAGDFNTAVQNAIDTEFDCIQTNTTGDCLLVHLNGITEVPSDYTQLKYLESDGASHIDTGISSTSDIGVVVKYAFMEMDTYNGIFGNFNPHYYLETNSYGTDVVASYGPTGGSGVLSMLITDVVIGQPYTFNINYNNSGIAEFVDINRTVLPARNFSSNAPIYMFGVNMYGGYGNRSKSRIYYMKITDGTALVRDFVPARRNSDNELGMYDLVSNTFFTNNGTGEFIAGPAVYMPQSN